MLLEPSKLAETSRINPEIAKFIQDNPSPPLDFSDAATIKDFMAIIENTLLEHLGPAEPSLIEEERQIPMRDEYLSSIKVHRPAHCPSNGSPLIVLLFGGGFIAGGMHQLTSHARALVRLFGAVVVSISYRLAPEHKWPVPVNDGWDSLKWCAAHAKELNANPTQGFVVGGVSAGAIQSAVISCLAVRERLQPPITGVWLAAPGIMDAEHVPEEYRRHFFSREHNKFAPGLTAEHLDKFREHTQWGGELRYPILFKDSIDFSQLPHTLFTVSGMDPLRDDGLIYEEILKEYGVKTRLDLYPGAPHAHWAFMPGLDISTKALVDINVGFGWILSQEVTADEALKAYKSQQDEP